MIKIVTITGADYSILPERLFSISEKFPFVEWAILISRKSIGQHRFPPMHWIKELLRLNNESILHNKGSLNLSLHLCGSYVSELLAADSDFIDGELDEIWNAFSRVQINTHGEKHFIDRDFTDILNQYPDKEFIFQYDLVNTFMLELAMEAGVNCSALFDLSHGTGVLPDQWPALLEGVKCGYAGGISPENIKQVCTDVSKITGDVETWIDMETHVRSLDNKQFDIAKVIRCLQTATDFVKS